MSDSDIFAELKLVLKCLVRGSAFARMRLPELTKQYEKQEGERLYVVAGRYGYENVSELINSFPEFKVTGNGLQTIVQLASKADLNKDVNKRSSSDFPENGKRQNLVATIVPSGPSGKLVRTINKIVPRCVLLENLSNYGGSLTIRILEVQNPHRFWFAERAEIKKLNDLMVKMNNFYTTNDHPKVTQKDLLRGLYVAVSFFGLWHRGFVLKVWPEDMARVLYVDFGTVNDVPFSDIRFLSEEFLALPATAHRGVLSHIQPTNGTWGKDATDFMKFEYDKKWIETKIFKKCDRDSSYFMALRSTIGNEPEMKLVTNVMIEQGYCVFDPDFMERAVVNKNELEFVDYENGGHLPDPHFRKDDSWLPTATAQAPSDSWMPSTLAPAAQTAPTTDQKIENKSTQFIPTQVTSNIVASSRQNQLPKKDTKNLVHEMNKKAKNSEPSTSWSGSSSMQSLIAHKSLGNQRKLRMSYTPPESIAPVEPQSPCEISSLPTVELQSPPKLQIEEKSLCNLEVGDIKKIYIHVVNALDQFYFYLKEEMMEIRSFLKDFNYVYEASSEPQKSFTTGVDVVTYADENFCRGRIVEAAQGEEDTYKIFLLDYGIMVERTNDKIFKLRENWMRRQAAVYSGELANIPEHAHIKTPDQLAKIVHSRYVRVRISRVDDKSIEIHLIDS